MKERTQIRVWGRMLSQCPRCGEYSTGSAHSIQLRRVGNLKKDALLGATGAVAIHSWYDSTGVHRYKKTCYLGPWDSQWDPFIIRARVKKVNEVKEPSLPALPEPCSNARAHPNAQPAAVICTHCNVAFCNVCAANHLRGRDGRLVSL